MRINLPPIPDAERTPLVVALLAIIDLQQQRIQTLEETVRQLRDEIAILKGEQPRPTIAPSTLEKPAKPAAEPGHKRPGSARHSKQTATLVPLVVTLPFPDPPPGFVSNGYEAYDVQELVLQAKYTRCRRERIVTPTGQTLLAPLPVDVLPGSHFGPELIAFSLYQYHQCNVTQPLPLEQLRELGLDISAGQLNHFLTENHDGFHREKAATAQPERRRRGVAGAAHRAGGLAGPADPQRWGVAVRHPGPCVLLGACGAAVGAAIPYTEAHRLALEQVRQQLWDLYQDLKAYRAPPDPRDKAGLAARFDLLVGQKTDYPTTSGAALKAMRVHKADLLRVLSSHRGRGPEVPLHNNGTESIIRGYVKTRKISGSTRSAAGRRCRDTFASLKKTCRKLGESFWEYLKDRVGNLGKFPRLADSIRQRAAEDQDAGLVEAVPA